MIESLVVMILESHQSVTSDVGGMAFDVVFEELAPQLSDVSCAELFIVLEGLT